MTITDEDLEYVCLYAMLGDTDLNQGVHALFDLKAVDDPATRDIEWRRQKGPERLSSTWCRLWLQYGYSVGEGWDPLYDIRK